MVAGLLGDAPQWTSCRCKTRRNHQRTGTGSGWVVGDGAPCLGYDGGGGDGGALGVALDDGLAGSRQAGGDSAVRRASGGDRE
jgi:hypothetical protein